MNISSTPHSEGKKNHSFEENYEETPGDEESNKGRNPCCPCFSLSEEEEDKEKVIQLGKDFLNTLGKKDEANSKEGGGGGRWSPQKSLPW